MKFNRRRIMQGAGSVAAAAIIGRGSVLAQDGAFQTPLPIPEIRDARMQGGSIELAARRAEHAFFPGRPTPTYGFSRSYLGPTLRFDRGDTVEVAVENALDDDITAHWHGVLLPAELDGGPHAIIPPGETWRPALRIDQPEATVWYHSHPHGDTARQVYLGLAGMAIIEDGTGERLGLPRRYGIDDLPVILQDRRFDRDGSLVYDASGMARMIGMRGDTFVVNGAVSPVATVPAGLVRLRLLNAANARNFHLRFQDGRRFHVIASDGGYLATPVPMTRLTISPSERFEILVDFAEGDRVILETGADAFGMHGNMMGGMMQGMMGGMMDDQGADLMRFVVDPSLPREDVSVPGELVARAAPDPAQASLRRRISLDMGPSMMGSDATSGGMMGGRGMGRGGMMGGRGMGPPMGINGRPFDMDRIDYEIELGSTEIWEVTPNMMAHPFHVHGVIFHVLSIGGKLPPAHLRGGKDTVLLDEPAELIMQFTQRANREYPFMFHCHILEHEDGNMMGQYITT